MLFHIGITSCPTIPVPMSVMPSALNIKRKADTHAPNIGWHGAPFVLVPVGPDARWVRAHCV